MRFFYFILLLLVSHSVFAKELHYYRDNTEIIVPESSQIKKDSNRAVTDIILINTKKKLANGLPDGETPASLACVYGLTTPTPGCGKNIATAVPNGGWGAIALVDAFYDPYAENDLLQYTTQFHVPSCTTSNGCFNQYYATAPDGCNNVNPPLTQGWWDEQSLDIEMAHGMAPHAKIFLVEAASEGITDLLAAERCASSLVAPTGGVISNSWSYPEVPADLSYNSSFTTPGIVYFGSSGDYGAPARFPSSSPNIISAGGTEIIRDANGFFVDEVAWSRNPHTPPGEKQGSSGGPSRFQTRPSFQNIVQKIVGTHRGTPDIAFDASAKSGIIIYSTYSGGWKISGGTSASSPALAGIINSANHRARNTAEELSYIYSFYPKQYHLYWHDIVSGHNGYQSMPGYDFVTGLGSPRSYVGK